MYVYAFAFLENSYFHMEIKQNWSLNISGEASFCLKFYLFKTVFIFATYPKGADTKRYIWYEIKDSSLRRTFVIETR